MSTSPALRGDADLALLFPGQGSQTNQMRESVASHRPELLALVTEEVGSDPFEHLDDGTRFVQPALYCASVALWSAAGKPGAAAMAGHSLGELAALAAAGAISPEDGARLAVLRGRLMQDAAESASPGGMVAVLGDDEAAGTLARSHAVTLANDNAPGQMVVSGPTEELDSLIAEAKSSGVRTFRLAVAGAFHSPAMEPALPEFRAALDATDVETTDSTVWCGSTAAPFANVRESLAQALVSPVRWRETLIALQGAGINRFAEAGPGKVLKGLVSRTLDGAEAFTLAEGEAVHA